ncbi:MAG TPA: fibronectin type III domain-containing protein [Actinomycetota bacterium]|nr:fibronectin type III domain-containing protein [Actinomycetota bacterium]
MGTAFASPDARQFLTSALGAVTRALGVASDADDSSQQPTSARTGTRRPTGLRKGTPSRPRARPSLHPGRGLSPATTQVGRPPSPSGLTAVAASPTEIDLTWADVTAETGYRVERSLDGSTDWTTVATTGQDLTTQSDTGLSPGTTYYYRVFATNGGGDSSASDVALALTNPV